MALIDGQIQIARVGMPTITLNQGTPYTVTQFNPWDRGVRADQGGTIPWGDGEWSGAEWRTAATIPLDVEMDEGDWPALMQAYWALDAALAPVRTGPEAEITWSAGGTEYLMYGRPRGATMIPRSLEHGTARVTSSLVCLDPAIYSAVEHSVTMGLLYRTGGFSVPMRVPVVSASAVADGEVAVTNAGTALARLLLRITGPVPRPRVSVVTDTTVQTLYLDTVLGPDDWLDIDTAKKSIVLNGSVTRLADQYGDWPLLPPGPSLIRFESDIYEPLARLNARWRDTN
jgi:hypothetical protein